MSRASPSRCIDAYDRADPVAGAPAGLRDPERYAGPGHRARAALWVAGIVIGLLGHPVAIWAARLDPLFVEVGRRHLRLPGHLEV